MRGQKKITGKVINWLIVAGIWSLLMVLALGKFPFLAKEEVRNDLVKEDPSANQAVMEEYQFDTVKQGDLNVAANVECSAQLEEEIAFSFQKSGVNYENVYVQVGDEVKKGDLLAELDMDDVEETLLKSKSEYEQQKLEVKYLETQIKDCQKISAIAGSKEEQKQELTALLQEKAWAAKQMELAKARYEETEAEKKGRQIVATQDGIVTFVDDIKEKNKDGVEVFLQSRQGAEFIRISKGNYVFQGKTKEYQKYPVGTQVNMEVNDQLYKMKVVKSEPANDKENRYLLTLDFLDSAQGITSKSRGKLVAEQNILSNVLYVQKDAIMTYNNKTFVYVTNKDGVRQIKEVETGLDDGTYIEIKSGVKAGEKVILK